MGRGSPFRWGLGALIDSPVEPAPASPAMKSHHPKEKGWVLGRWEGSGSTTFINLRTRRRHNLKSPPPVPLPLPVTGWSLDALRVSVHWLQSCRFPPLSKLLVSASSFSSSGSRFAES